MVSDRTTASRVAALGDLAEALGSFQLRYAGSEAESARAGLLDRITHGLTPRLRDPDGPLVVAVVGQSGSGKSTLVNSLGHRAISPAGALRPTTKTAVAWVGERMPLPLEGLTERVPSIVADDGRPPPDGMVIVDTPDPAYEAGGESIAHAVLEIADVCMFVASASRYADAAGWDLIEQASRRHLPSLFVLNRLPSSAEVQTQLVADFARRLAAGGFVDRPDGEVVIAIAEGPRSKATDGLPHDWVTGLRKEVEALLEPSVRHRIRDTGLERGLRRVDGPLGIVRTALVDEAMVRSRLLDPVRSAVDTVGSALVEELDSGGLGDLGSGTEHVAADLAAVVARRASSVSRTVASAWERDDAGQHVLRESADLWSHGHGITARVREAVTAWSADLPALVAQAVGRRRVGRRRRLELATAIERLVIDPTWQTSPRMRKRLDRITGVVPAARRLLAEVLLAELDNDAARFVEAAGADLPADLLERLRWEMP